LSLRTRFGSNQYTVRARDDFDEDNGEELYEVEDSDQRQALSLDVRSGQDDDGRLSRDLEEGFKDDSDDDDDEMPDNRRGSISR
jgi:hypothetical protein